MIDWKWVIICNLSPPLFCNTSATRPLFPDNQVDLVFNAPTVPRLALCLNESLLREKDLGELPAVLTGRTQHLHMHNGEAGPTRLHIQTYSSVSYKHLLKANLPRTLPLWCSLAAALMTLSISDFSLFESFHSFSISTLSLKLPREIYFYSLSVSAKLIKTKNTQAFCYQTNLHARTHQLLMKSVRESRAT